MKIKMLASFAGDWSCSVGDEIDRPDAEARRLIEAGFAVPVRTEPVERAVVERPAETADRPRQTARGGR